MTQNKFGVLLSMCLLLALTGAFFVAARTVLNRVHSSVASAVATSTTTALLMPTATAGAPAVATSRTAGSGAATETAPTETPTPRGQIVMSISPNPNIPMASIPSDTAQVYCIATLPQVATGTPLVFHFQMVSTPGDYFTQPFTALGGTGANYSYIYGPLQRGKWRCVVNAGGKPVGTALFTIV
jgi:hypothetical protein